MDFWILCAALVHLILAAANRIFFASSPRPSMIDFISRIPCWRVGHINVESITRLGFEH